MAALQIRFAPIAALVGLGLIGYGVGGVLGAGVALVLPMVASFFGALFDSHQRVASAARLNRPERTLRHRYFLWLDQRRRRRAAKRREREQRKEAERNYLERRKRDR